jgi:hypothetical protein
VNPVVRSCWPMTASCIPRPRGMRDAADFTAHRGLRKYIVLHTCFGRREEGQSDSRAPERAAFGRAGYTQNAVAKFKASIRP